MATLNQKNNLYPLIQRYEMEIKKMQKRINILPAKRASFLLGKIFQLEETLKDLYKFDI